MINKFSPESDSAINGVLKYFRDQKLLEHYIQPFSSKEYQPDMNASNFIDITNDKFFASEKTVLPLKIIPLRFRITL